MAETQPAVRTNPKTAYEASDWPLGLIGLIYIGVLALLVISPLVLMWAYSQTLADTSRAMTVTPPAPRLEIDPAQDLAALRDREAKELSTYYWIDKPNGIVHIPIEQAMQKLAKQGIPGFPRAPSP